MFMRAVVVTDDMDIEVLLQTGISAYSLSVSVHRNWCRIRRFRQKREFATAPEILSGTDATDSF